MILPDLIRVSLPKTIKIKLGLACNMLKSVKEVLISDIEVDRIKNFLEIELEVEKMKSLLSTEIHLKENLLNGVKSSSHPNSKVLSAEAVKKQLKNYDANLIDSLQNDHTELLFVYDQVIKNAKAKKYTLVNVHLETFKKLLEQHYQKADKELYGYLELFIRYKYPKRQKAFDVLNKEMKQISISIFYYLSETVEIKLSNDTYYCFMCSFTKLGKQLNKRIDREVNLLHSMYKECNIAHQ